MGGVGRAVGKLLYGYRIKEQASKFLFIKKKKKKKKEYFIFYEVFNVFVVVLSFFSSKVFCHVPHCSSTVYKTPLKTVHRKQMNGMLHYIIVK